MTGLAVADAPPEVYPPQLQLKMVQIFFRHEWPFNASGKAPNALFSVPGPKLVAIDDEVEKPLLPGGRRPILCDKGELTDVGRASATELGRRLRKLYVEELKFMPVSLNSREMIHLRSTQYQRTFVSLQHVFSGLYPDDFVDRRGGAVLAAVADPRDESLFPPEDHDARFAALLQDFSRKAAIKWNHSPELRYVNDKLGRWMPGPAPLAVDSKPLRLHDVLDTISAVAATPRPQDFLPPDLLDPGIRAVMERICAEEEFSGYLFSSEFRRLGVGKLLQEAVRRMSDVKPGEAQMPGRQSPRMLLFACHDSTLAGILTSLGVMKDPDWFWPPYSAHVTMELFHRVADGVADDDSIPSSDNGCSRFFRLKYQGKPVILPCAVGKGNHLPGHEDICTFEALADAINEFAPTGRRSSIASPSHDEKSRI
ncbi:putative acid phosphatase [Colletotrichum sidae]|uniref:Putative acid phosphatase n=1 Tax=Colletotrichum sidae TaxID=1347389 RepID=A0A4R8TN65_9PEZI|nr:putative acid phosphatase [Colletotrichum sidae]